MRTYQTKVKLHDTDAGGVMFFTSQLKMVHDAYEALMGGIGFGFAGVFRDSDFYLPIVHSESDYKLPLFVGDAVEIQTTVAHIGKTSFALAYTLLDGGQRIVGTAQTVHVSVDKTTRKKIPLPADLRAKLEELR